ncbi:MAG: TetR/AcrR family transcriptional regulator [Emergencia sp.]|nr:TetR/AcrR family transcriptional regulator [Emergencia sp.]
MENGKKALTRITIMRAARGVYEEKGIENTNFRDIAAAAGVSRSTVFNYFAGSSELLTALCGQEISDLEKAYLKSGHRGKEGIVSIFDTFIEDTARYPQLVTQIIYSTVMNGGENNPLQMIEALIAKNLDDDASGETATLLMGAYYGLINHYHLYNQPFDSEKMKAEMRRMIDAII